MFVKDRVPKAGIFPSFLWQKFITTGFPIFSILYSKLPQWNIFTYSWSSNFAVNVLEDDPAKIESANFILLVKLGSRAAIGYYPLRERGAANIRIREYQYREYR